MFRIRFAKLTRHCFSESSQIASLIILHGFQAPLRCNLSCASKSFGLDPKPYGAPTVHINLHTYINYRICTYWRAQRNKDFTFSSCNFPIGLQVLLPLLLNLSAISKLRLLQHTESSLWLPQSSSDKSDCSDSKENGRAWIC